MSSATKYSFQKKSKGGILQIPGTKPSLQNNQLLVSTGIPSLDNLIGGGVAVGTIMLIEEDTYGSYSRLMLKYFSAESIVCGHELFLASADGAPQQILDELPAVIMDDPGSRPESSGDDEAMKIAWRYQHLPQVQPSASGNKFGHYYDLTKTMNAEMLEQATKHLHHVDNVQEYRDNNILRPSYQRILQSIKNEINKEQFSTSVNTRQRNILRVALHSLGSPMWGENGGMKPDGSALDHSLPRFLYALRCLMRTSLAVCLVTMPTHLMQDACVARRVEQNCDTVVRLESFAGVEGKETNPVYKEYHGLFHIVKLPRLNSLTCQMPDTLDLTFKLKRKKFVIERLHLPPELSETANRSQEDPLKPTKSSRLACGGDGRGLLDF